MLTNIKRGLRRDSLMFVRKKIPQILKGTHTQKGDGVLALQEKDLRVERITKGKKKT